MTRSRRALEALVSGCIVYTLMAACSSVGIAPKGSADSTTASTGHTGHTGGSAATGHGGMAGSGGNAQGGMAGTGGQPSSGGQTGSAGGTEPDDSGIFDALLDPVSDAMAAVENPQSGTRLKGKFTLGSDGSKEYQLTLPLSIYGANGAPVRSVWYDSLLQEDCTYQNASDGTLRCLPGIVATIGTGGQTFFTLYYTDAQCTQPVVAQLQPNTGCLPYAVPKHVLTEDVILMCIAPDLSTTTQCLSGRCPGRATGGDLLGCAPRPLCHTMGAPGNVMAWYSATELPPSMFVQGTAGIDP